MEDLTWNFLQSGAWNPLLFTSFDSFPIYMQSPGYHKDTTSWCHLDRFPLFHFAWAYFIYALWLLEVRINDNCCTFTNAAVDTTPNRGMWLLSTRHFPYPIAHEQHSHRCVCVPPENNPLARRQDFKRPALPPPGGLRGITVHFPVRPREGLSAHINIPLSPARLVPAIEPCLRAQSIRAWTETVFGVEVRHWVTWLAVESVGKAYFFHSWRRLCLDSLGGKKRV